METVESKMLAYIERRLEQGALSVSTAEIMEAVVPPEHPEFRYRPAYRHGLDRMMRRHVINAIDAPDGRVIISLVRMPPRSCVRHWDCDYIAAEPFAAPDRRRRTGFARRRRGRYNESIQETERKSHAYHQTYPR